MRAKYKQLVDRGKQENLALSLQLFLNLKVYQNNNNYKKIKSGKQRDNIVHYNEK